MQQVHINRLSVNSIEFNNDTVEIPLSPGGEQSSEIVIINYGSPTHVHLSTSESLNDNVVFLDNNPYVRHEEYVPVMIRISPGGRLFNSGQIHIAVGYGSKKESFNLKIGIPDPDEVPMEVDVADSLYSPHVRHDSTSPYTKKDWNVQFSEMSNQLLNGIVESFTPRSILLLGVMSILLIILYFVVQATTIISIEPIKLDAMLQIPVFYVAVAVSILFTALIAYLIIKLPSFK
ncbi:MAG TPA: hypothetical protein C5S50_10685 [Methanosarcinaceae archaeon]|nr:hypothetical protein [Methanosarcinaceae archaeon]